MDLRFLKFLYDKLPVIDAQPAAKLVTQGLCPEEEAEEISDESYIFWSPQRSQRSLELHRPLSKRTSQVLSKGSKPPIGALTS